MRNIEHNYKMNRDQQKNSEHGYGFIEVSVEYTLGGYSYFSGERHARGYRVSFKPLNIIEHDGYKTREMIMMSADRFDSGFFIFVEEANRFGKKKLEEIASHYNLEQLGDLYADDRWEDLREIVQDKQLVA